MKLLVGNVADVKPGLAVSGRAVGARPGPWQVKVIAGGTIQDDRLDLDVTETMGLERTPWTERYLLQPSDVLVTARSTRVKAALVPPTIEPTVANSNLLVVRPHNAGTGPLLWWFFTSEQGRAALENSMKPSATLSSLPPSALAVLEVPWPPAQTIAQVAALIDASEQAYRYELEVARATRTARNRVIEQIMSREN